jgi:hypothetical protein
VRAELLERNFLVGQVGLAGEGFGHRVSWNGLRRGNDDFT